MIADNAVTVGKISGLTDLGSGEVISSAERTKLSGIETSADVTDSTNVLSALNADLGGDFTIGTQSDDTATFGGNVTVQGNLLISGTTTTINTTTFDKWSIGSETFVA